MKYLFGLVVICFCLYFFISWTSVSYHPSPREQAVNNAMRRNSKALAKKYCIYPIGVTVGMPGGDIQYLELEFQARGPYSREDSRKLLMDVTHDFLSDLNSDHELCNYLGRSFSIDDIGIHLFFVDSSRLGLRDPHIGIAQINRGKVDYSILDEFYNQEINKDIPYFKYTYEETYEEALGELQKCG